MQQTEQAVVAALLRGEPCEIALACGVSAETFTSPALRTVWEAVAKLAAAGQKIDLVMVAQRLLQSGELEAVGGELFLAETVNSISSTANLEAWCKELKAREATRLLRTGFEKLARTAAADDDPGELLKQAAGFQREAERMIGKSNLRELPDVARSLRDQLTHPAKEIPFFPAGTAGAAVFKPHPTETIIIAARTGEGKTALAVGAAVEQLKAGLTVAYFCTESTSEAILLRIAAAAGGFEHWRLAGTHPAPDVLRRGLAAIGEIQDRYGDRLFVIGTDRQGISAERIAGELHRIQQKTGRVDVVYVDFIQNLTLPGGSEPRLIKLNAAFKRLHDLFIDYRCTGFCLAQYNRAAQRDGAKSGGRPDCTWLKDSSELEQLASTVVFLLRQQDGTSLFYSAKTREQRPFDRGIVLTWDHGVYRSAPCYTAADYPKAK